MARRSLKAGWLHRGFAALRSDPGGSVAVEFAVLAPILIFLLLGALIFGNYLLIRLAVIQATAEGARASLAGLSDTERTSLATNAVKAFADNSGGLLSRSNLVINARSTGTGLFTVSVSYGVGGSSALDLPNVTSGLLVLPALSQPSSTVTVSYGGWNGS